MNELDKSEEISLNCFIYYVCMPVSLLFFTSACTALSKWTRPSYSKNVVEVFTEGELKDKQIEDWRHKDEDWQCKFEDLQCKDENLQCKDEELREFQCQAEPSSPSVKKAKAQRIY